jgi:hypothetical protein
VEEVEDQRLIRRLVENTEGKDKKGKDTNDFAEDMINF